MLEQDHEITLLLERWGGGDRRALDELLPLVYCELKRLAAAYLNRERDNGTLQTTALVHEAYLRLVGYRNVHLDSRKHFFVVAAQALRRVLVDHARRRDAGKRQGSPIDLPDLPLAEASRPDAELIALDQALEQLSKLDDRKARVVELRYFVGLSVEETADALGISGPTVKREWTVAKAWLYHAMNGQSTT